MSQHLIHEHLNLPTYRKRLKELRGRLDQLLQSDSSDDPDLRVALNRLDVVLRRVRRQLRGDDANFLTPQSLGELGSSFDQAQNAIDSSRSLTAASILAATDEVIEAYRAMAHIPPVPAQAEEASLEYASQIEALLASTDQKIKEQRELIASANLAVKESKLGLGKMSKKVASEAARIDEAIATGVAAMTKAATDSSEKAAVAEAKRTSEWNSRRDALKLESDGLINHLNEENINAFGGWKDRAERTQSELEDYKDRASRIVELISDSGQAGHYKSVADKNQLRATICTILAFILYMVPVLIAMATWWSLPEGADKTNWTSFFIRVAVGVTALLPATYAAAEAKRYKRIEDAARQRQLEFSVISSYLEELSDDQQAEIRGSLASVYFGNPLLADVTKDAGSKEPIVSMKDLLDVIKTAVKSGGG